MQSTSRAVKPAAKPRRRTQTERRATTRQQLLDAAIDCVYELGFNGATLSVVAERAGVTRGAVQHHFGNKDDLVLALVNEIGERLAVTPDAATTTKQPIPERVAAITAQYWRVINSRNFIAAIQLQLGTMHDAELHDRIREILQKTETALDRQWIALFSDRDISPERAVAARHVALAAMRGLALRQIFRKSPQNWDREIAMLQNLVEQAVTESK